MAKVWFCIPNKAVIPAWMVADCIRDGQTCNHLVSMCENDLPSETIKFGE